MAALSSTTTTTTTTRGRSYEGENLPQRLQFNISPRESCVSLSFGKRKRKLETIDVVTTNAQNKQEEVVIKSGNDIKWPFLHHFHIDNYRICLALCSQSLLWKVLEKSSSLDLRGIAEPTQLAVWCLALLTLIIVSLIYALKFVFYANVVQEEYFDRVGVNYFFAPWISCILLSLAVPSCVAETISPALWCVFVMPVILLEIKIYGQWFSGGQRRLSKVANPSTYLSIVGNFVGAMLAARVGWKEPATFMFAVGFAHYTVLFVTLYQRLPTNEELPKELNPTFFLFLAAPSTASLAYEAISSTFGLGSKMPYFLSLFLFASMVVRINFFWRSRYSVAWWAYVFPVTAVAIATIRYSDDVRSPLVKFAAFIFSVLSVGIVIVLLVTAFIHYVLSRHGKASQQILHMYPMAFKKRKIYHRTCLGSNNPNHNLDLKFWVHHFSANPRVSLSEVTQTGTV